MITDVEVVSVWHNDGHALHLMLNKSLLVVTGVDCPGAEECSHPQVDCIVQHFVYTYGLECNVGVVEPHPKLDIAWTLSGDAHDIDACQVWIIPSNDEAFAAWAVTQ